MLFSLNNTVMNIYKCSKVKFSIKYEGMRKLKQILLSKIILHTLNLKVKIVYFL